MPITRKWKSAHLCCIHAFELNFKVKMYLYTLYTAFLKYIQVFLRQCHKKVICNIGSTELLYNFLFCEFLVKWQQKKSCLLITHKEIYLRLHYTDLFSEENLVKVFLNTALIWQNSAINSILVLNINTLS